MRTLKNSIAMLVILFPVKPLVVPVYVLACFLITPEFEEFPVSNSARKENGTIPDLLLFSLGPTKYEGKYKLDQLKILGSMN